MRDSKQRIIKIREQDMSVIEIEIENSFIEFYKKETGRSRATENGLRNFINNLFRLHKYDN